MGRRRAWHSSDARRAARVRRWCEIPLVGPSSQHSRRVRRRPLRPDGQRAPPPDRSPVRPPTLSRRKGVFHVRNTAPFAVAPGCAALTDRRVALPAQRVRAQTNQLCFTEPGITNCISGRFRSTGSRTAACRSSAIPITPHRQRADAEGTVHDAVVRAQPPSSCIPRTRALRCAARPPGRPDRCGRQGRDWPAAQEPTRAAAVLRRDRPRGLRRRPTSTGAPRPAGPGARPRTSARWRCSACR